MIHHKTLTIPVATSLLLSCFTLSGGAQEQWKYTALGDSLATGYLAQEGYVPTFETYLETDNTVAVTRYNLAQNGSTSAGLLSSLRTDTVFQNAVLQSAVITWNIGLNDLRNARTSYKARKCGKTDNQDCLRTAVAAFKTNWDAIVMELLDARNTGDTIMRTMTIYNPWVAIDGAANTFADSKEPVQSRGTDLQVLAYYLDQMNSHIAISAANHGFLSADVHGIFNGESGREDAMAKGYIGSDGIHPTNGGHRAMADLLRGLGYAPIR